MKDHGPLSAAHLRSVLDHVTDGVFLVDRDLRIMAFNHAAELLTGYSRRAALGKTCTDVLRNQSCGERCQITHARECTIRRTLETARRFGATDVPVHTHDGRHRVFSISTVPLTETRQRCSGVAVVFQDVTELRRLSTELHGRYELQNLIGKSHRMQAVYRLIEQAAESNASVLIEGETGTGKELVSRAIHVCSHRSARPFVVVNCSALPETLLESELFGHVKGAFTGAVHDSVGRFQMAEGGTILLDEIGEISPLVQLKLLRFTEEKVIERVGEGKPVRIDVRLISATNKDLKALVAGGRFREDLYYRLRVLPIYLPPLRQRKDDIVLLVRHFVNRFRRTMAKAVEGPDERALAALLDYPWPGNVRELENAVEHAFVRCRTERFTPDDLPVEIRRPDLAIQALSLKNPPRKDEPADEPPAEPERERLSILRALEATGQRREQAADLLGLGRTTLWRKMKKLGIPAVSRPQDGGSRGPDPPTA